MKLLKVEISILLLTLFCFSLQLGTILDKPYLMSFFGFIVLLYLSGHNLLRLIRFDKKEMSLWGRISLDVIVSMIILVYTVFLIQNRLFGHTNLMLYIILLVNIVFILFIYLLKYPKETIVNLDKSLLELKKNKYLLVALIPILLVVIRSIMIPYIGDWDPVLYVETAKKILDASSINIGINHRRFFTPEFLIVLNNFTGISLVSLVKFIMPLFMYITGGFLFFDFCLKKIKNEFFAISTFMLFISAPSLILNNEFFKTEIFLFAFTLPILIFWQKWYENKDEYWYFILSLLVSGMTFIFHELGIIFILLSFLNSLLFLIYIIKSKPNLFTLKRIGIYVGILLPYLILFKLFLPWKSFIGDDFLLGFIKNIKSYFPLNWDWWFLSSYKEIDTSSFSYKGITILYYYLFHGLLLFLSAIYLFLNSLKRKININISIIVVMFVIIFFIIAEILPRMGVYFLPYRAWPYLACAAYIAIALLASKINNSREVLKLSKLFVLVACAGILGSFMLMYMLGTTTTRSESNLISALKNKTEKNAVIVSGQANQSLVLIYAERQYQYTDNQYFNGDMVDFKRYVLNTIEQKKNESIAELNKSYQVFLVKTVQSQSGEILSTSREPISTDVDKNYRKEYIKKITEIESQDKQPVYYIYSFAKFRGPFRQGPAWLNVNDYKNYGFFSSLEDNVIYSDKSGIIIKIK